MREHDRVTLVLSVHSRDNLWVVVDRRLSYGDRRPPIDDAVKIMSLETVDGLGLLAYAGLGATPRGTQPSAWMSAVLRGLGGLGFEQSLRVLVAAANEQLPRHLAGLPEGQRVHSIIVPAFVADVGSRLYTIDNMVDREGGSWYRFNAYERAPDPSSLGGHIELGGTGGTYLAGKKDQSWKRILQSLVKTHDRGKVSDHVVADRLARLNYEAHQRVRDGSVGPRCIVVWRRRRDARQPGPGGGQQYYTGLDRDLQSDPIPTLVNALDLQSIAVQAMQQIHGRFAQHGLNANLGLDEDDIKRILANLPHQPDDKLR